MVSVLMSLTFPGYFDLAKQLSTGDRTVARTIIAMVALSILITGGPEGGSTVICCVS
jgi:hypothetical protein